MIDDGVIDERHKRREAYEELETIISVAMPKT
jgi:hypothetical protein